MTPRKGSEADATSVARAFAAKARAELAEADRQLGGRISVKGAGDPLGRILLVKGAPGPADLSAGRVLAGPDGEAAAKALEALGRDASSVYAVCSRPGRGDDGQRDRRLELVVEAVDPEVVLALDREAAEDLARAARLSSLPPGRPRTARGRVLGAVDGLEASLPERRAKARVWAQMRAVFADEGAAGEGSRNGKGRR